MMEFVEKLEDMEGQAFPFREKTQESSSHCRHVHLSLGGAA